MGPNHKRCYLMTSTTSLPLRSHETVGLGPSAVVDMSPEIAMAQPEGPPPFDELVRQQAVLLARGEIGADNLQAFLEVANQIVCMDTGDGGVVYVGADGRSLAETEAGPLYRARSPDVWVLTGESSRPETVEETDDLTYEQLSTAAKVFEYYDHMPLPEIPEDVREELYIARVRTSLTLGISDPNLSLGELAGAIRRRQELSDLVTSGVYDHLFLPRLLREYRANRDATTTVITPHVERHEDNSDELQERFDQFLAGGRDIGGEEHRRRRRGIHRRQRDGRWLGKALLPAVATIGVSLGLRAADVVPFGSIGVGAVTGAVGMMISTRLNKEVWGQQRTVWQKMRTLGKAALAGAGIGMAFAAGTILTLEAASAAIDAIRGAFVDIHGVAAAVQPVPDITPELPDVPDTPIQPTTPSAFGEPLQTEHLGHFDGTDGPDNNPWLENTGYDAIADRLDAEYQRATGKPIDWSAINQQDYHNFVGQVLEQNGLGWSDVMHPGDTLTIDSQHALEFLRAHLPDTRV